jgi:hypothetical protein
MCLAVIPEGTRNYWQAIVNINTSEFGLLQELFNTLCFNARSREDVSLRAGLSLDLTTTCIFKVDFLNINVTANPTPSGIFFFFGS